MSQESPDAPIANFSQCHAGIVSHLNELSRLPVLLDPAAEARRIAADILRFFRDAVYEHHSEEERDLFPATLASAEPGPERDKVQGMVDRLTREHRAIEAAWSKLEPGLERVAKGRDTDLDRGAVTSLVTHYKGHAQYEEAEFLPLAQAILGRNSDHMAALGLSLHMRHVGPALLRRVGQHI